MQSLPVRQLPQRHALHRTARPGRQNGPSNRRPQLARLQTLAARALQEGRALRIPARVQPTKDAGVQLLHAKRVLLQRRRVPVPARRSVVEAAALSALRHGLLSAGAAVFEEACQEEGVRVLSGGVLSGRPGVQGGASEMEQGSG